ARAPARTRPAGTRGSSAARGHDLAREQLDRREVLHVERLEHDARDADLLPALELVHEARRLAIEKAGRAPGGFGVRHAREDLTHPRQPRVTLARVATDDVGHHQRAADRLRITARLAAERVEHAALGGVLVERDARDVPLVGAGGDDRQRALLAAAADDQRDPAARRQRVALGVAQRVVRLLEGDRPALPERADGARAPAPALPREPFLSLDHEAEADRHRGFSDHWLASDGGAPAPRNPKVARLHRPFDSTCARPYHNVRAPAANPSLEESMASHDDFTLDAKYRLDEGTIFLSGIQALVRLPLDQHRADARRGVRTAT